MIFYLIRHGQTDWNIQKRMQGHADIPMNETGIQQINDLAEKIVKEGIRFDRLIASPLKRARKSAEIIAEKTGFQKDIIFDEDFVERDCGLLEGEIWTPELDLDDPNYKMETIEELCERAEKVFKRVFVFRRGKDHDRLSRRVSCGTENRFIGLQDRLL